MPKQTGGEIKTETGGDWKTLNPLVSPGILYYAQKGTTFIFQFLLPNVPIWQLEVS